MKFLSIQGLISYEAAREFQLHLVDQRAQELISDTVLFLEHTPVITRGRGLQFTGVSRPRQMPLLEKLPETLLLRESERGGDLTYHGPGQLVVYPICKLDGSGFAPNRDIAGFIRKLEKVFIGVLASYGLDAETHGNATGVWIGAQKIVSIGIAVRKWVSYHGAALNCTNALQPFHLISPCGFSPSVMTRLCDHVKLENDWRNKLEVLLSEQFTGQKGLQVESLSLAEGTGRF